MTTRTCVPFFCFSIRPQASDVVEYINTQMAEEVYEDLNFTFSNSYSDVGVISDSYSDVGVNNLLVNIYAILAKNNSESY